MLTTTDKELALTKLEKLLADAKERASVATVAALETDVAAVRTKFDADPATVTAVELNTAKNHIAAFYFDSAVSMSDIWTEINTEANPAP